MSDSICWYQWVSQSPSSQAVPSSSSHSLLTFPSSSLLFHNISSSVPSTALGIQHSKFFTMTSGETHSHAVMIHFDQIIHSYFLVCKLSWSHEEALQYSPQMVLVVLWISNMCVLYFFVVSVVWSVWVYVCFCGF